MEVLNTIPHLCYLLRQNDDLYLNTLCWRGPMAIEGYEVLIKLTSDERCAFDSSGIAVIENLAKEIQQNSEKYVNRSSHEETLKNAVSATIKKWLVSHE